MSKTGVEPVALHPGCFALGHREGKGWHLSLVKKLGRALSRKNCSFQAADKWML
jgi:hypothetical protein